MVVTGNDIVYTLSGGSSNIDPASALGGPPSTQVIAGNEVFNDISEEDSISGRVDYRCIYIANNNPFDSLFATELSIIKEVSGGATIDFGVPVATDIQRITVSDTASVTGGNFTIGYESNSVIVNHDSDVAQWATNLQDSLNALDILSGIIVTVSALSSTITFTISFQGDDNFRNHDLISLVSNNLIGGNPQITTAKIAEGAPINTEAQEIPFATTDPFGITFQTDPLDFGVMRPSDLIPIWIRRETASNTEAKANDGVTFRIIGKPFQP